VLVMGLNCQKTLRAAKEYLGCQIWIEQDDTKERIEYLFKQAKEAGLGWARIFLMWPWIEEKPGKWDFTVFDYAFDAAYQNGIKIKATLTANSGPWHIGTPLLLHSHTGFLSREQRKPMREYITQCVKRYKEHPALGQWILWNEPNCLGERTEEGLKYWRAWLNKSYEGNIEILNHRWRTGYKNFDEIPFPEEISYSDHRGSHWESYRPYLDDMKVRSEWLTSEIKWIQDIVREIDSKTETCINPVPLLDNQAQGGANISELGRIVDVIGASYHPGWHFTYANRNIFPALMYTGVKKQAANSTVKKVEVTEVQTGNTLNSSLRPCEATANEIGRFFLSSLAAGADSVTGWCFNVRKQDFEAGDWGLLDDFDKPSDRSRMLRKIHDFLNEVLLYTGEWKAYNDEAIIGYDIYSEGIEAKETRGLPQVPGRLPNDGARGNAMLSVCLQQCGISSSITRVGDIPITGEDGKLLILSNLAAWDLDTSKRILDFVKTGGKLILDGTCGRKDLDANIHRPWPGGISEEIGMRALGLQTNPKGYDVVFHGIPAGKWLLTRNKLEFDEGAGWKNWDELRFSSDGEACVWERNFGKGNIYVARGMIGPTLVHNEESMPSIRYIINKIIKDNKERIYPIGNTEATFVLPVSVEKGSLWVVIAPEITARKGQLLHLKAPKGNYKDLWTGNELTVSLDEQLNLLAVDGIAVLWREQ
jgi:hypothetical protein